MVHGIWLERKEYFSRTGNSLGIVVQAVRGRRRTRYDGLLRPGSTSSVMRFGSGFRPARHVQQRRRRRRRRIRR